MSVLVYRNITSGTWSILDRRTGRVVARRKQVGLRDAKFIVRQGGRLRVLAERRKNVHAFVSGILAPTRGTGRMVRYNPYETETFVDRAGRPVLTAKEVTLRQDGRARAIGVNA